MDILNFISWVRGRRQVTTVDANRTLIPVGLKDGRRDDDYIAGAITVQDFVNQYGTGPQGPIGPAGPQGVQGPIGAQGIPGPVGPAGLNWQGAWSALGTYVIDDAVGYNGASWFCIDPVGPSVTTPDLDPTNWALLAAEGAQGPQGIPGVQGPTGAQGPAGTFIPFLEYDLTDKTVWNNGQANIGSNTTYGEASLAVNTTGSSNTAIGAATLNSNNTGSENTAIGFQALKNNTTGTDNVAIGTDALLLNDTSSASIAIGNNVLTSNVAGFENVAIGHNAMFFNTSGVVNVALGGAALNANTTGGGNVAIGVQSLLLNTSGSNNTAVGYDTRSGNFSGSVILGANATATANNQFVAGSSTVNAGAVASEVNTSTQVWNVIINGVARKILLA